MKAGAVLSFLVSFLPSDRQILQGSDGRFLLSIFWEIYARYPISCMSLPLKTMRHSLASLPGEIYYRQHYNQCEMEIQQLFRKYQNWRMNIGLLAEDIDVVVSNQSWESFNEMRFIEYAKIDDECVNYAILEMKHLRTSNSAIEHIISNSTSNKTLANAAKLPFFVVKYFPAEDNNGHWEFSVYPANNIAADILSYGQHMSERQYIEFLYTTLRGIQVPEELLSRASTIKNSVNNWEPL